MPQYLVLTEVCLFGRLSFLYPQFKIWFTSYINVGKVGPWSFWSKEARQHPTSSSYLTANLSLLVAIIILRVTLGLCRIALWERLFTQFPTQPRNSQWKNGRYFKVLIEVTNFSLLLETGPPFYVATQATRSSSRLQGNWSTSYFKNPRIGPAPELEPATSRSTVKRPTDCANPASVKRGERGERVSKRFPQCNSIQHGLCLTHSN